MALGIFTCMMTGTVVMAKRSEGSRRSRKIRDVALIVDRTDDNEGFQILRRRHEDAPVELGTMRPLREGKPIDGEVVSLRQRRDLPFLYDVKTELETERRATADGPAQVATDDYRRGWDAIWGRRALPHAKPN
jgi:hypothetical protein